MNGSNRRVVSVFLFCGALATGGCSFEEEPDGPERMEGLDARGGGGGGGGHGGGGGGGGGGGHSSGGGGGVCHGDHTPPVVDVVDPIVLWPPNHKYHTIDVEDCIDQVTDCDPNWEAEILYVTSDEPENGLGDGNTLNDMVCLGNQQVKLRAERQGAGNGRVYTIHFEVTDSHHNTTQATCTVVVPHDMSGAPAVDDTGANPYTVTCY